MANVSLPAAEHLSLVEAVDRVLNKGAVIAGDVTISVADIDLVRLDLQIVLAATETLLSLRSTAKPERET